MKFVLAFPADGVDIGMSGIREEPTSKGSKMTYVRDAVLLHQDGKENLDPAGDGRDPIIRLAQPRDRSFGRELLLEDPPRKRSKIGEFDQLRL